MNEKRISRIPFLAPNLYIHKYPVASWLVSPLPDHILHKRDRIRLWRSRAINGNFTSTAYAVGGSRYPAGYIIAARGFWIVSRAALIRIYSPPSETRREAEGLTRFTSLSCNSTRRIIRGTRKSVDHDPLCFCRAGSSFHDLVTPSFDPTSLTLTSFRRLFYCHAGNSTLRDGERFVFQGTDELVLLRSYGDGTGFSKLVMLLACFLGSLFESSTGV